MKILPVTAIFFLWQEVLSCDRKFCPVMGKIIRQQEISSCDRKFLSVTWNFVLSEDISFFHSIFFTVIGNSSLWLEIASCNKNFFPWYEVSYTKFLSGAWKFYNISSFWYRIATKSVYFYCVDWYKIFLSLWLLNWPGGRVDGQEGVPGVLGWAVLDGYVHPFSFSRVFYFLLKWYSSKLKDMCHT